VPALRFLRRADTLIENDPIAPPQIPDSAALAIFGYLAGVQENEA
jgi:hypothetical protein